MILHNKLGKMLNGGRNERERERMTVRVFVCFLLPTDWEKRATVRDAAVMWAGKRKDKRKEMGKRGSGSHREVADSERKISRRGS